MMSRILSFGIFAVLIFGMVRVQASQPTLMSFDEMKALQPLEREIYIYGLQELLVRVNELDAEAGIDFMSQDETSRRSGRSFAFVEWDTIFSLLKGERVWAESRYHYCIYAGWIQDLSMDNAKCPRPAQGTCGAGYIECNPMAFGSGICIRPQQTATKACQARAKRPEVIWSETQNRREDWERFRGQIDSFCERAGKRETETCSVVKTQLTLIRSLAQPPAPKPSPTPNLIPVVQAPTPRPAPSRTPLATPSRSFPPRPAVDIDDDDVANLQTTTSPAEEEMLREQHCNFQRLMERVEVPDDFKDEKKAGERPLLNLNEAQILYCGSETINTNLISERKNRLTKLIARLGVIESPPVLTSGANPKQIKDHQKDSRRYSAKVNYFNWRYNLLRNNLDNCLREAQQKRASKTMPVLYQRKVTIQYKDSTPPRLVSVTNHQTGNTTVVSEEFVSALLSGVHVCEVSEASGGSSAGDAGQDRGLRIRWNSVPDEHAR